MTPIVVALPLDPTGIATTNLIPNEPVTLIQHKTRVFAVQYGAFFADSLVVVDTASGNTLTRDQYYAAEMYELPSAEYGAEICCIVVVTDQNVGNSLSVTYQALGGLYGTSQQAIVDQINALSNDGRPVAWGDIIQKPTGFTPTKHLHDIGDVYGFEYLVSSMDRIAAAINLGDAFSHDAIYQYIDNALGGLQASQGNISASMLAHINNTNNPHQTTAAEVGTLTTAQINALTQAVQTALTNHIGDQTNPHGTTAHQTGAYTQAEVDNLLAALETRLTTVLNSHINNVNNPHQTSAAQTGAYTIAQVNNLLSNYQQLASAVNSGNFASFWDTRLGQRFTFQY